MRALLLRCGCPSFDLSYTQFILRFGLVDELFGIFGTIGTPRVQTDLCPWLIMAARWRQQPRQQLRYGRGRRGSTVALKMFPIVAAIVASVSLKAKADGSGRSAVLGVPASRQSLYKDEVNVCKTVDTLELSKEKRFWCFHSEI